MGREPTATPLYAAAFVLAVDAASAGHLFPALEAATHAPPRGASWFLSIYMLGALLGAPVLARVAAKRGRTEVLTLALATFASAALVVALSSSYPVTLAARFVQGFAGSPILPLGAAHVATLARSGSTGRKLGSLSLSYSGGFLAGMAFVSLFLLLSFRVAYLFTSLLAAGTAIGLWRMPRARRAEDARAPTSSTILAWFCALALASFAVSHASFDGGSVADASATYRALVRSAKLLAAPALFIFAWRDSVAEAPLLPRRLFRSRIGVASASLAIATGLGQATVVLLPTCAIVQLGVSAAASGPLLLPVVAGGLAANLVGTARLDRWGARPFLTCGVVFMTVGTAVTATLGDDLFAFELGALALGVGVSAMSSGPLRYLVTTEGPADAEAAQASVSLLTNVGLLLGGALWGSTVTSANDADASTIRAGLLVLTAAIAAAALALPLVPTGLSRGQAR